MNSISVTLAVLLYLLSAGILFKRLSDGINAKESAKRFAIAGGFIAIVIHLYAFHDVFISPQGLNFSFFLTLSFTAWLAALIVLLSSLRQPIENLGIAVFPFTAISLIFLHIRQTEGVVLSSIPAGLETHIIVSAVSYSLLALAALQSILLAIQNKQLRNRHPGGFVRALPPLETMEALLFQLIGIGYVLLSISLVSAVPYTHDIFAQHLVHKTILSISAWIVFAILIWGRWHFGWRGRTAIRWTLSGFVVLMLAYFGSKMVRELILGV